jgi:hypothetical protein
LAPRYLRGTKKSEDNPHQQVLRHRNCRQKGPQDVFIVPRT